MARARKAKRWLREHAGDEFVKKARHDGYRSRAAYKLLEIERRHRLLRAGMQVVELGAAPGGWTQVLAARLGGAGRLVACDLLEMAPLPGVHFVHGDFTEKQVRSDLAQQLRGSRADLVISDMAPNLTGIKDRDRALAEELALACVDFAAAVLAPGGATVFKAFTGPETDALRSTLRSCYQRVSICKPAASRERSAEIYVLARGYGI